MPIGYEQGVARAQAPGDEHRKLKRAERRVVGLHPPYSINPHAHRQSDRQDGEIMRARSLARARGANPVEIEWHVMACDPENTEVCRVGSRCFIPGHRHSTMTHSSVIDGYFMVRKDRRSVLFCRLDGEPFAALIIERERWGCTPFFVSATRTAKGMWYSYGLSDKDHELLGLPSGFADERDEAKRIAQQLDLDLRSLTEWQLTG